MSRILIVAFVVVVAGFCTILSTAQMFPARQEEVEICEKKAKDMGKEYKDAKKNGRIDCKVTCIYKDETTSIENTRNGTLCCPVGGMPTGTCKGGECKVGSMG